MFFATPVRARDILAHATQKSLRYGRPVGLADTAYPLWQINESTQIS